jgi:UDP-2,3-diacylglucosamine pyrophosphatase LpxH
VDARPNILIISDLHLGEDLRPATKIGSLKHLVMLERELEAFLEHYTRIRLDGRPWRLIVNGDMVDFLSVCLLPPRAGAGDSRSDLAPEEMAELDPEDQVYGLGSRPLAARAKMRAVIRRHRSIFGALARFIGAGNTVSIIAGNHDVEFHWPVVQETFRCGVAEAWEGDRASQRPNARSASDVLNAITFHPWFFFQEDVVWVEHGHQYDDYCSFDQILNPVAPKKEEIVQNVGAAGMRYVANHHQSDPAAGQEDWTFLGYVKWTFQKGMRSVWMIGKAYFSMVMSLLTAWRVFVKQPEAVEQRRLTHRERLRSLATQCQLSEETLHAIDELRRRPLIQNFFTLIMAMMLDRLLVFSVSVLLILVFVLALPWAWALGAVAGVLGVGYAASTWLARRRPSIDPIEKMKAVPNLIRRHVRAPFVVFGHSHDPAAVDLGDGAKYFNTGTWVATEKPGLLNSFTHVLIRHGDEGPQAQLCQWWDGQSRVYTPRAV